MMPNDSKLPSQTDTCATKKATRTFSGTATARADSLLMQRATSSSEEQNQEPQNSRYSQATFPGTFGFKVVRKSTEKPLFRNSSGSIPLGEVKLNHSGQQPRYTMNNEIGGEDVSSDGVNAGNENIVESSAEVHNDEQQESEEGDNIGMTSIMQKQIKQLREKKRLAALHSVKDSMDAVHRDTVRADANALGQYGPDVDTVRVGNSKHNVNGYDSVVLTKKSSDDDNTLQRVLESEEFTDHSTSRTLAEIDEENKGNLGKAKATVRDLANVEAKTEHNNEEALKRVLAVLQHVLKEAHGLTMENRSSVLNLYDALASAGAGDHMKLWKLQAASQLESQTRNAMELWKSTKQQRESKLESVKSLTPVNAKASAIEMDNELNAELHAKLKKFQNETEELQSKHQLEKAELASEAEQLVKDKELLQTQLEQQIKAAEESQTKALSEQSELFNETIKKLESQIVKLTNDLDTVTAQVDKQQELHQCKINELAEKHKTTVSTLESELNELGNVAAKNLQVLKDQYESTISSLKQTMNEIVETNELQGSKIVLLNDNLEKAKSMEKEKQNEIKLLNDQIRDMDAQLSEASKALESAREAGKKPSFNPNALVIAGSIGVAIISWYLGWLRAQQVAV